MVCILLDKQSILQNYIYDIPYEKKLQDDKDTWADNYPIQIADIDTCRKKLLQRFFSKLQRHEELLDNIKAGCKNAEEESDRICKNPDFPKFLDFVDYYECVFYLEKSRFSEVFTSEIINFSLHYKDFNEYLKRSFWEICGDSAALSSRDKLSKLCDIMMMSIFKWRELFLQHEFFDAGAHQKHVLDCL